MFYDNQRSIGHRYLNIVYIFTYLHAYVTNIIILPNSNGRSKTTID
jgi:hypothetical protein